MEITENLIKTLNQEAQGKNCVTIQHNIENPCNMFVTGENIRLEIIDDCVNISSSKEFAPIPKDDIISIKFSTLDLSKVTDHIRLR
jgi:hypothetical protein